MHTGDAEDAYRRCLNLGRVVVPLPIVDEVQGLNTLGIPLVLATRAAYGLPTRYREMYPSQRPPTPRGISTPQFEQSVTTPLN